MAAVVLLSLAPWVEAASGVTGEGASAAAAALVVAAAAMMLVGSSGPPERPHVMEWALWGWALLAAAQCVPLPRGVVGVLSPETARLRDALVPGAVEEAWRPLSLAVGDTIAAAWWLAVGAAACGAAFRAVRDRATAVTLVAAVAAGAIALAAWSILAGPAPASGVERLRGPFLDANGMAAAVVTGILCAAGVAGARLPLPRGVSAILAAGAILVLGIALARTGGRMGTAALAGGAVAAVLAGRRWAGGDRAGLLVGAAVVGLAAALVLVPGSPVGRRTVALVGGEGAGAVTARAESVTGAAVAAAQFPLTGVGVGAVGVTLPALLGPDVAAPWTRAHTESVQIALEGGIPALALALVLIVLWLRLALAAPVPEGTAAAAAALLAAGVALLIHSQGDHPLRTPAVGLLAAIVAGASAGLRARGGGGPPPTWGPAPGILAAMTVVLVVGGGAVAGGAPSKGTGEGPEERVRHRPLDVDAHLALAAALRIRGDPAAAAALDRCETVAGARDRAWMAIAEGRLRLAPPDVDGAVRAWREAVRRAPGWTRRLLERMEREFPARDPAEVVPVEPLPRLELVRFHRDRGRPEAARRAAEGLREGDFDAPGAELLRSLREGAAEGGGKRPK